MPAVPHKGGIVTKRCTRVSTDGGKEDPEDEGGGTELDCLVDSTQEKLLARARSRSHHKGNYRLGHHGGDGHDLGEITHVSLV